MQGNNKIEILCTRPLPDDLLDTIRGEGIGIDIIPFIETEPIQSIEVQQEVEQALAKSATIVFTSMNAVDAVAGYMDEKPDWRVYCIGTATRRLVEEHFGKAAIAGTAPDASELAELIVEEDTGDEIIFFCGNQRRDELPSILEANGLSLEEIVVYETVDVPRKLSKVYNGVLFFSPSAVDSFFSVNKVKEGVLLFAIGNTTAKTIKKYSSNKVIISDEPGKENLVEKMLEIFGKSE
ncbi:MAG: uroporphyrinogen-III synthase [Bacteroidetes bacterium]|nr:uroporphyrinogen-III synthase [Bacteroidota bacterium]